ncbi:GGDEF domain-containing protein [Butyrivibrio sp. AE3004]|uniref:GGDEF domain-containing protein n=1 Tax=Butyrivibrio sp. AE3004 TaxID=1506994 RepID=UPI00049498C3|nr:GGDEF domain-containing protein [Butyrivibrio sp. AE3004]
MNPEFSTYDRYKIIAQSSENPCAIISVKKNDDGTIGEIRLFATNEKFSMTGENVEGELYTKYLPREPEFEDMCVRAAFNGERLHIYVDTTKMLGAWSENLFLPLKADDDGKTGYCQFVYELTKDMDAGKFSAISPKIAGFVIKSCLELRSDNDFKTNLKQVLDNIREFTGASAACVVSINKEDEEAEIINQSNKGDIFSAANLTMNVPYNIASKWVELVGESDCFIMRDKAELEYIEETIPDWANKLKVENAESLCLMPIQQRKNILGYILVTNFNVDDVFTIKETLEILSLFLSAEMANNQFLKRLEWLTSVDMRTGVRNRSSMNRVVDEYAEQLKWHKTSFGVAFCKLNGLKFLNAKYGHDAGNKVLEEAGEILLDIFEETEVFRSGGEEFAVVCENADEKEFTEKIERLRKRGSNPEGVYFAIGYSFDNDEGDLRKALRLANQQTLEEKEAFYEKYPEKKNI